MDKKNKQNETFLHSTFIFCVISDNYDSNQAQAFILQANFNFLFFLYFSAIFLIKSVLSYYWEVIG